MTDPKRFAMLGTVGGPGRAAALGAVALLAALLPARRATKIDLMEALRAE